MNERADVDNLNLVYPQFKRESAGGKSFSISTIRLWNKIPSEIRNKQNLICFQKSMLEHFVNSCKDLDYFAV